MEKNRISLVISGRLKRETFFLDWKLEKDNFRKDKKYLTNQLDYFRCSEIEEKTYCNALSVEGKYGTGRHNAENYPWY